MNLFPSPLTKPFFSFNGIGRYIGRVLKGTEMKNIMDTAFSNNVKQFKTKESPATQEALSITQDENGKVSPELTASSIKIQFNKAILQSNMELSLSAGNEPLALLYKTAIEGINDILKADFGENAIQTEYDSGLDISPEATADRIVSMSTAFFPQYQKQNTGMTDEDAAHSFITIIQGGINKGFSEAKELLDGFNVLEGDVASNIEATFKLVQIGLKAFINGYESENKEQ